MASCLPAEPDNDTFATLTLFIDIFLRLAPEALVCFLVFLPNSSPAFLFVATGGWCLASLSCSLGTSGTERRTKRSNSAFIVSVLASSEVVVSLSKSGSSFFFPPFKKDDMISTRPVLSFSKVSVREALAMTDGRELYSQLATYHHRNRAEVKVYMSTSPAACLPSQDM